MQIHPTVVLSICDYCSQESQPPRFSGPLFGHKDVALACSKETNESMPVSATLELLRKTSPHFQLLGWYYVGFGLVPENVRAPAPGSMLVLFEMPPKGPPLIKAFKGGDSWARTDLRLNADAASRIALEDAVNLSQTHDERRAKAILRDRIRSLKDQLKSDNNEKVAEALYKYSMLKKVCELQNNAPSPEDDFYYELLAEVVMKADNAHYGDNRY